MREWGPLVVSIIGLGGIIVAILAFEHSVDSSHADDQRTRYETISAKEIELDSVFVTHPELLPYFWGNRSECRADPSTFSTVAAAATQRADDDAFTYSELVDMGLGPADGSLQHTGSPRPKNFSKEDWEGWTSWSETIINHFQLCPAMCDELKAAKESYAGQFVDALKRAKACDFSSPVSPCWHFE